MRRVWKLSWRRCFLHHSNLGSTFHWPGAGLMLLASVLLFCCYGGQPYGSEGVELVSGAALLFLLLCNLYLMHRQGQLKRQEIPRRLQRILQKLHAIIHNSVQSATPLWGSTAYPELLMPHSQAIGLQWTFRDGRLVNLPATLLVEGDIISLRPGQQAPTSLRGMKEDEHLLLAPGDLYFQSTPLSSPLHRDRSLPQSPHTPGNFRVTQTPVIEDVRRCLNKGTSRPVSVLNNECYALRTLLHKYVVPVTLAVLLLTNILRFMFNAPGIGTWKYTLIQLQVNGVLPLLPLLFPVLWVLLNAYGEAKVLVQFSKTPPVVLFAKLSQDTISSYTEVVSSKDMWLYEWRNVLAILAGRSPALCCTASLLHHLGSVTVLCCVDKQGILSWPNPSPDKVAFFSSCIGPEADYLPEHASFGSADGSEEDRETELCFITETASRPLEEDDQRCNVEGQRLSVRPSPRRWNVCCKPTIMAVVSFSQGVEGGKEDVEIGSEANVEEDNKDEKEEEKDDSQRCKVPPPVMISEDTDNDTEDFVCDYRFETLSLSQDQQNPAAVQFDDSRWPLHAASLKPLGLNVLLAACSGSLAERSLRLCDHLASEALEGRASSACLPPQPLCGLCDLPKLIGFMPSARDVFTIESYVALYQPPTLSRVREVGQDIVRRLPAAVKHRLPLPHLLSLLVRDMNSGALQLLSHGTADLILEGSTDLWDGSDIYPLSPSDRKKVLDFYQRACLSGYCTAFSYKPMSRTLSRHLNGHCIELQVENDVSTGLGLPSSHEGGMSIKLGIRKNSWSSDEGIAEIQDRADCVQALSGQIFMGLVSTQYQAQIDIVRLIDRLDNACIRFVYFSLEDELRSKVFSEKMGLETGWNCHISLQSSGYEAGMDGPHGTSQAGSLHENPHHDGETQQLLEEETHSDVVSYPPTDSDAPSILECSNRAKLPRGIENIRPHLANIDNVPLLVPLFTDCTPDKICEMVQIMQEYGEVVCCLGSSANDKNSHVFLQSNVSLALDPLYPSRCTWDGFSCGRSANINMTAAATATAVEVIENGVVDPLHISAMLNSLPCSMSFQNEKNMSLIKLVKQSPPVRNLLVSFLQSGI
uniref:endoplasmic reticulum magnesium-transporting P-type ATPase isoform X1 n=1 Tax=Myxine glutinosa TaxID=7769 RepID=UPI00358ED6AC